MNKKISAEIKNIINILTTRLKYILNDNLLAIYITGSISYGGFDPGKSDIDLVIIINKELMKVQLNNIIELHLSLTEKYPIWGNRLECSYITPEMLNNINIPIKGRLYINNGKVYTDALYGNEWLINLHTLYECGINVYGPCIKEMIKIPIDINEVRKASKQDLYQNWASLLNDCSILKNSEYNAYIVLTLCRILYREKNDDIVPKNKATIWVKEHYKGKWSSIIEKAENYKHGQVLNMTREVLIFLKFVLQELR
ncbi:MAG: DUF4111 domain-containing protein [Sphingobacteriia bacterium]|nr:DUF4111 domain-containing protein [Sphingobacteriia bacterium]